MKRKPLSEDQITVLLDALDSPVIMRRREIRHGTYRSLVIRGLLMPHRLGLSLTPEGHDMLNAVHRRLQQSGVLK